MIQAMILIQLQMRKKKGIRSLNIILILTTLDIGASISDRPSLAMYGRPYFLFQIYIYSYKQYFRSSIVRCTFHKALQYSLGASQNIWTFIVPFTLVFVILTVNARKIVSANSAVHGSHWTIINSLLPLSLLLLQLAAAQIKCGSLGHCGHHSCLHLHWVETGPGTSLDNAVCYCIYPRTSGVRIKRCFRIITENGFVDCTGTGHQMS